jgi:HEAT repeat protein
MSRKRLFFVLMFSLVCCQQSIFGEEEAGILDNENESVVEAKLDDQLQINKNALLQDPNEQIRIKAAMVMLHSNNPIDRDILINILIEKDNKAACMAICKALIQTIPSNGTIKDKEDFILPVLGLLDTEVADEARLAAETTRVFNYESIGVSLEEIATDVSKPIITRLNTINALKLRSDMKAVIMLINLIDDAEKQVAAEAEKALRSMGIQVGRDPETRKRNIEEIKQRGQVPFLRDLLIRQETQIREMREELNLWQKRYISALDRLFDAIQGEKAKGDFLSENLNSTDAEVKKWAIDEIIKWRQGTNPNLPDELGLILINLISDKNKDIRLKTAELMALWVKLNSAKPLLTQLDVEKDDQVKTALLVALGEACYYALPNPPEKISPEIMEIRKKTLEWAAKFLSDEDVKKSQTGSQVMKKLLKRDGLNPDELNRYLALLVVRYEKQKSTPNGTLREELLSSMSGLCAQDSVCKDKAGELFGPIFEEALRDETDFVRETAVDGLMYIDKTKALETLRDVVNDPSVTLRKKIIAIADEVGSKEDLNWLAEKIGVNSESEPAWQAMRNIFRGSDAIVFDEWVDKLTSQSSKVKLNDEQKINFLKIAESKVANGNKQKIRKRLAALYYQTGQFEQAAEYLRQLYETTQIIEEKDEILPDLIYSYLKVSKSDSATELLAYYLAERDIDPNNAIIKSLEQFFTDPPSGYDLYSTINALSTIKPPQQRPMWNQWLQGWAARLKTEEGEPGMS